MPQILTIEDVDSAEPTGASHRVYLGLMQDLEERRIVPGQRLVETELAARFGIGRNAVREAMQHLAVRGVVDLSRHRSPAIRRLDPTETLEVLDVAAAMTRLAARTAALHYEPARDAASLAAVIDDLARARSVNEPGMFSRARRRFYRTLLAVGGNRELQRLYPAIGMHIIYSQYQSPRLQELRLADYGAICDAVRDKDADRAEITSAAHVEQVRQIIIELSQAENRL